MTGLSTTRPAALILLLAVGVPATVLAPGPASPLPPAPSVRRVVVTRGGSAVTPVGSKLRAATVPGDGTGARPVVTQVGNTEPCKAPVLVDTAQ